MERRTATNVTELIMFWEQNIRTANIEIEHNTNISINYSSFQNIDIDFKLHLPFTQNVSNEMITATGVDTTDITFSNCNFNHDVYIDKRCQSLKFSKNCVFNKSLKSNGSLNNIIFNDCIIKDINFKDATFGSEETKNDKKGKVKFRNCDIYATNFKNTTFNSIADFWNSTFHQPVTFYKTDFRDMALFSAVTFKENVLFTYTLIEKSMILRGACPEKGFDISLAIIAGELSIFNFLFDDYNAYTKIYKDLDEEYKKHNYNISHQAAYETVYEKAVSENHQIPLENKRETYRILKNQLISQQNFIDAVPFRVMENKTLLKESYRKLIKGHTITRPLSNIIVLFLNAISNWFGSSYIIGLIFTISIASIFFNQALSHIGNFMFTWNYENWQWKYFIQFINPTHRPNFMNSVDENPKNWFYIWDFLGRIFVGYGIYQTITAFRKYK